MLVGQWTLGATSRDVSEFEFECYRNPTTYNLRQIRNPADLQTRSHVASCQIALDTCDMFAVSK